MATVDKAAYTLETKQELAQALIDQGQTVDEYDTFRSYADKIRAIKSKDHALTADHATEADTLADTLSVEKGGTGVTSLEDLADALGIGQGGGDEPVAADGGALYIVNATSTDGATYTATDDRIKEVKVGTAIILVPNKTSTTATPTLDLNGTGAVQIGLVSSVSPSFPASAPTSFLTPGCPFIMIRSSTSQGERWLSVTPGSVAYAVEAGTALNGGGSSGGNADYATRAGYADSAGDASTFAGSSYGSLFGSSPAGYPSAHRANALMGMIDGDEVSVDAGAVIALQNTVDGHWVQTQTNATSIQAIWDVLWPLVDRVEALEGK